jgi:hypothetical protein
MRRVFLLAFAAFFLMSAAWAVALPVNGTYDERHHLVRAYAVAEGELFPAGRVSDPTGYGVEGFDVPRSLLPDNVDCTWYHARRPASCQVPVNDRTPTLVSSNVARYSPVYYLPVGLPLLAWPDRTGVLVARLVSALMSALLLASAAVAAVRLRSRFMLVGLVLVATPMAMNLAGSVNPNGLEISAGVALFATLLALLRAEDLDERATRRLLLLAGVATVLLLTVRQLGPLLLAVDALACLLLARPGRVRELWRRRDARVILGVSGGAGIAFFGYWTVASAVADISPAPERALHLGTGELLSQLVTGQVPFYLHQIVGQFGYGETTISKVAIWGWYALFAVLVIPAFVAAGRRAKLVLGGLTVFCLALLVTLELYFAPLVGWTQHGRYAMPTAVGVVLIAGLLAPAWLTRRSWLPLALAAGTVVFHGYALARVMTRYQVGISAPMNPLHGSWLPPGGSLVPLALLTVGLVLLIVLVGTTRQPTRPATTVGRSPTLRPYDMAH